MATPKAHTLIDVFLPDGFGAFGFGQGGFGGNLDLLNPQWNTNSGSYGFDYAVGSTFVEATSTPSYVGAAPFDITYDSFFAKITPAPFGNGNIQTALIVRANNNNYVEVSVGPQGNFSFYVANNSVITVPGTAIPAYNPVNHAFWRIRNDNILFYFDTSPDGSTWTNLASLSYSWDATSVVVMFFAGFNGSENPGQYAHISNVNLPGTTLQLSSTGKAHASANAMPAVTVPFQLASRLNGKFGVSAKFTATLGLPQGGVTDFSYALNAQSIDPIMLSNQSDGTNNPFQVHSATPLTTSTYSRGNDTATVAGTYRDGSYFPQPFYVVQDYNINNSANPNPVIFTANQIEYSTGFGNRVPLNVAIASTGTYYSPGPGCSQVVRSTAQALNGQYSYAMSSNSSPITLPGGRKVYYPWPTESAMIPVKTYQLAGTQYEQLIATISFNTARANTQWFPSFIFYDANFNILTATYLTTAAPFIHPGGNVWQTVEVINAPTVPPTGTVWAAVVPCVMNETGPPTIETVYFSNPAIYGASINGTDTATSYVNPNTMNVNVKADRVNYVLNGGFNSNVNFYSQVNTNTTGTPNPVTFSWDITTGYQSVGSAKVAFSPPSGTFSGNSSSQMGFGSPFVFSGSAAMPVIQGLKVGHTYTISAWIKQDARCPDVFMNCFDADFAASGNGIGGISTNAAKSANGSVNGWTQVFGTFTVPPLGLPDMGLFFYVKYNDYILATATNQTFTFWVDDILLEEATSPGTFFDGNTATNDYMWESGGTANASRSYYYKNFTNKVNRLNAALPLVTPVGATINLEFAQPIQTV